MRENEKILLLQDYKVNKHLFDKFGIDYEELLKCGANFASSPKRINIHALDPAIIATTIALTEKGKSIDLIETLNKTKYGSNGIGGIKCNGLMYVGYPRWLIQLKEVFKSI